MPDVLDKPDHRPKEGGEVGPPKKAKTYGDPVKPGPLMSLPAPEAAKLLVKYWTSQDQQWAQRLAEWDVNERRRGGECNIWAAKTQDRNSWQVYRPPGSSNVPVALFNKSDRLCQRECSQVYADEPIMEATPENGTPEAREAAELSTRVLKDLDSEANLNDLEAQRAAFDIASSFGSGYIRYFVDPMGGGRHPIQIEAGAEAQHVEEATAKIIPGPVDPMTGMPGPPIEQPWPSLTLRYVGEDGTLLDDAKGAALRWHPRLCRAVIPASQVRFRPADALDIWDAEMVMIAGYETWATLCKWYPKLKEKPDDEVEKLSKQRPAGTQRYLPQRDGKPYDPPAERTEDKLVFHLLAYATECPDYADGLYMCVLGDSDAHLREPWIIDGESGREPLDLPLTQVKQFRGKRGDPHGAGLMDLFGPANEARSHAVGAMQTLLDQLISRKVFIPSNSTAQKGRMMSAERYISINPGGEPKYEEIPTDALKPAADLFDVYTAEMDDASGLGKIAQALESEDNASGKSKYATISQVQAGLSDVRQNVARSLVRAGRIKLQLTRKDITVPMLLRYTGEDGEYKVRRWMSANLGSTRDVTLVPGSLSMSSPAQKAQDVMAYGQAGLIPPDEVREMAMSGLSAAVGYRESPHLMRVRQQIAKWEKGPEELAPGAMPQPPVPAFGMAPPTAPDPMTGAPVPVPGAPPMPQGPMVDPVAFAIFDQRPVDGQPDVAQLRARELGRAMAGHRYTGFASEWRAALDVAYQTAMQAAMPPMPVQGAPGGQGEAPGGQEPGPKSALSIAA